MGVERTLSIGYTLSFRRLIHSLVIVAMLAGLKPPSTSQPVSVYAADEVRPAAALPAPANYIVPGVHLDPVTTYRT